MCDMSHWQSALLTAGAWGVVINLPALHYWPFRLYGLARGALLADNRAIAAAPLAAHPTLLSQLAFSRVWRQADADAAASILYYFTANPGDPLELGTVENVLSWAVMVGDLRLAELCLRRPAVQAALNGTPSSILLRAARVKKGVEDAAHTLSRLAYQATQQGTAGVVDVTTIRFFTARVMRSCFEERVMPPHIQVHEIHEAGGNVRAYVCVGYAAIAPGPPDWSSLLLDEFPQPPNQSSIKPVGVVVFFTGTERASVWWETNLRAQMVPLPTQYYGATPVAAAMHAGFLDLFRECWDPALAVNHALHDVIARAAQNATDTLPVFVAGHSLGGALAAAAVPAIHNLAANVEVMQGTLSAPAVFNTAAVGWLDLQRVGAWQGENRLGAQAPQVCASGVHACRRTFHPWPVHVR